MIEALDSCLNSVGKSGPAIPAVSNDTFDGLSIDQLTRLRGWQQRYRQLLKWADAIGNKPEIRCDANRVQGCEAATWVSHELVADRHQFLIDSEARVVKGLAVILLLLVK